MLRTLVLVALLANAALVAAGKGKNSNGVEIIEITNTTSSTATSDVDTSSSTITASSCNGTRTETDTSTNATTTSSTDSTVTEVVIKGQCQKNEQFVQCPAAVCIKSCSDLGFPVSCPPMNSKNCTSPPGCVCIDGFVYNKKKCVSKQSCPSCGGDPNAISGCGNCVTCANYGQPQQACTKLCVVNSCRCRDGYILDTIANKCVKPCDCTPACGPNEEPSSCANAGCRRWSCADQTDMCLDPPPSGCQAGCVCKKNYTRDNSGKCIPINQCPRDCDENERFVVCPSASCEPQCCADLGYPVKCDSSLTAKNCTTGPSCICKIGFVRDDTGLCVNSTQCSSCGGDPYAVPGCGDCQTCQGTVTCTKCPKNSCKCKSGYIFDVCTKKCVLPCDCSS